MGEEYATSSHKVSQQLMIHRTLQNYRKHVMGANDRIVEMSELRTVGSPAHKYNHLQVNTWIIFWT